MLQLVSRFLLCVNHTYIGSSPFASGGSSPWFTRFNELTTIRIIFFFFAYDGPPGLLFNDTKSRHECKHGKADQKMLQTIIFGSNAYKQQPNVVQIGNVFACALFVVLNTPIQNMKMRLSRIIVKVTLESKITKFGFGRNFNDMEYYKLGISVT